MRQSINVTEPKRAKMYAKMGDTARHRGVECVQQTVGLLLRATKATIGDCAFDTIRGGAANVVAATEHYVGYARVSSCEQFRTEMHRSSKATDLW
jgi:hypothetical protein